MLGQSRSETSGKNIMIDIVVCSNCTVVVRF